MNSHTSRPLGKEVLFYHGPASNVEETMEETQSLSSDAFPRQRSFDRQAGKVEHVLRYLRQLVPLGGARGCVNSESNPISAVTLALMLDSTCNSCLLCICAVHCRIVTYVCTCIYGDVCMYM